MTGFRQGLRLTASSFIEPPALPPHTALGLCRAAECGMIAVCRDDIGWKICYLQLKLVAGRKHYDLVA